MYAVIDLETTGGRATTDKIIEIAIILTDGQRVIDRYDTLIHPECWIPSYITQITGIDNDMITDAPRFYEVAKKVVEMTKDTIFVAHNVSFDYKFMQAEFNALGFDFELPQLCTVRSSRKILPGYPSYSLGKLTSQLGIELRDRHRALGDAEATAKLLHLLERKAPETLRKMIRGNVAMLLPPAITTEKIREVPEKAGVFYLHNEAGQILYLGKSRNLRLQLTRLLGKIAEGAKKIAPQEVSDISWEETGSMLLAELLTRKEMAAHQPAHNKIAGKRRFPIGLVSYPDQNGFLRFKYGKKSKGIRYDAEFASLEDARQIVKQRLETFELCAQLVGMEEGNGACSHYPGGACRGACNGQESADAYNDRAEAALQGMGYPSAKFFIVEPGRTHGELSAVCVENGIIKAFGWLDRSIGWTQPEAIMDSLDPVDADPAYTSIIRNYLRTQSPSDIISYS